MNDEQKDIHGKDLVVKHAGFCGIDWYENGAIIIGGVMVTSAKQFHEQLAAKVKHPFARKQVRGPRKAKTDADPRVTVPGTTKGKK